MYIPKLIIALIFSGLTIISFNLKAQVTTATIGGTVTNKEGKVLAGATVKISFC